MNTNYIVTRIKIIKGDETFIIWWVKSIIRGIRVVS